MTQPGKTPHRNPATPLASPSSPRAHLGPRSALATGLGRLARLASRTLGRGSGGMIGGEVALAVSPRVLADLARGRRCVTVTGTNGKSTTNRMVRAALSTSAQVASNVNGDNMPPGIVTALMESPDAPFAALEVDEMHLPLVAADADPAVMVLLNLSRDQLDRVGEIGTVERRLRAAVDAHPGAVVVANCDDPLIASAAWDAPHVVWVAAGAGWGADSVGFPRGGRVVRADGSWHVVDLPKGADATRSFARPEPQWWLEDPRPGSAGADGASATLVGPDGIREELHLALPGVANLGNAAQAVAAAVALGVDPHRAATAVSGVSEVAGRYSVHEVDGRRVRVMLAKNPAGWQEAMTMIDPEVDQVVVAVNGQVPDGQDLSWLWDVEFSALETGRQRTVIACGERGADLAVRLEYAGIHARRVATPLAAIEACRPGRVELLANYTAFRDLKRILDARGTDVGGAGAPSGGGSRVDEGASVRPSTTTVEGGSASGPAPTREAKGRTSTPEQSVLRRKASTEEEQR